ncbi:HlyD family secretion protein [Iningainema tapete]|uniref:HlyD family efflux transporter periplasmic adaptor subunit n=1 Tax=Iningainema tapete BLCC-T55 TaxID=2748662 RepID=A0A8J7CAM3_9CYAN|nr:HlyD family efflux transporter periplasmic adaptor subunit [Iningainema tapete]MBD2771495.1 HlyD family efflux transporter periplasmic adaptor subunit [Iningainema tapete BLCC-T55]
MLYTENQRALPSVKSSDFLPPVSPWTSLAGITLIGTVGAAISLASSVKYNVTVKAPASVRPIGETRLVQPLIDGTIKSIYIKENQTVKQGDVIARLDDVELNIKNNQLRSSIQEGNLQLIQINAQLQALDNQIAAEKQIVDRTISSAKADLARNQREYQNEQVKTQSDSLAAQANLQKAEAELQKAKADLEYAKTESERYSTLVGEGAVAQLQYEQKKLAVSQAESLLEAQQKAVDIARASLQTAKSVLNPSKATVAIAQERIAQESAKGLSSVAAFIREKNALIQRRIEMRNQVVQSQKELQKNALKIGDSVIRATSDGTVVKLNLRNPGQVVRASEGIAEILPQNAPLIIKSIVPTSDIKHVAVGQKVSLRLDACPYPDYGTLKGVVSYVSPDAISPQANNTGATSATTTPSASYYEATIKPDSNSFGQFGRTCKIQAGMNAAAEIISKEETAMQFLLRKARIISDL